MSAWWITYRRALQRDTGSPGVHPVRHIGIRWSAGVATAGTPSIAESVPHCGRLVWRASAQSGGVRDAQSVVAWPTPGGM